MLTFPQVKREKVMALHLVGETLDRHRAFAGVQAGTLVSVFRGIYVDANDDIDKVVLDHAVRIAAFLYPRAYLSGATAAHLAPTRDGRLFLSGTRDARTRIRALEIVQNKAPPQPFTLPVVVGDDIGEVRLTASSPRQRFLEAFRLRSEHAGAIDPALRRQIADRLIEEYGSPAEASDALWAVARANKWVREGQAAETYLRTERAADWVPSNRAGVDLIVAWHAEPIGRLSHDGAEWRWAPQADARPTLVRPTRPGSLPPFIQSLLPEGWLADVLNVGERETLRSGRRYLSNITTVQDVAELAALPQDVLEGRLALFQERGLFTGRYLGFDEKAFEEGFQVRLARIFASGTTPRLSGIQIKAPMHLNSAGDLTAATEGPFTHILKPAGTNGFEALPVVEWIGLSLARAAGFESPPAALVAMPEGMAPALLVERFDIRTVPNDTQRIAMEDFCSVLDLPAEAKYDGTIERVARGLRSLSTAPAADLEILFQRALFAWFIADGDMHLKNLALLKVAEAGTEHFTAVRMAPVYDTVTTRIFPGLAHDRMALTLAGRDDRLTPAAFLDLARTIELPRNRADELMAVCARRVDDALSELALPEPFAVANDAVLDRIRTIVGERAQPFI